jgi:hypothetical protein
MKRILLLASLVLSAFSPVETPSQTKFHLEIGGGYVSNTLSTGVLSNWEGGWSINLAALCDLATCLQLTARTSYQQYDYAGHSLQLVNLRELSFRRKIDGDDTGVYEISFGARFVDNTKVKMFFAVRGGVMWIDIGRIRMKQMTSDSPDRQNTSDYPGSGQWLRKGFVSFGLGFLVPVGNSLSLVFESDLLSTFDREEVIIPLTASVQIGL